MEHKEFSFRGPFELESGLILPQIQVAYSTWGTLNANKDNVVWVCHALTANSDVSDWWSGLVGANKLFDPAMHFIVCANVLGSHYGSTNALSVNPDTAEPYYHDFPLITIRDIVNSLDLLRIELGINHIQVCIGGSLGGQQAMEWAILQPDLIENLILIATNARHSAWGIAFNEAQRMAIQADLTWKEKHPDAGKEGLKAARSIALLSYRNYDTYKGAQTDKENDKTDEFRASSYQQYQGEKLVKRFNAFSYWTLSKTMDSHNVGRNRAGLHQVLQGIRSKTLVIGISSDMLFPVAEQKFLASVIPNANYVEIDSAYGHDGFLIEDAELTKYIQRFATSSLYDRSKVSNVKTTLLK